MSGLTKRSFSLAGHRTSVALENEFWAALVAIAAERAGAAFVVRLRLLVVVRWQAAAWVEFAIALRALAATSLCRMPPWCGARQHNWSRWGGECRGKQASKKAIM